MKKVKIEYIEKQGEFQTVLNRIAKVEEDKENLNFTFTLEPKNVLNVKYYKKNNIIKLIKNGNIQYDITHIEEQSSNEKIILLGQEEHIVNVKTKAITYVVEENTKIITVKTLINNEMTEMIFILKEKNE